MPLLRPRERLVKSALSAEARIRYKGRRMHKRFRSWAQHRIRQYWLPQPVSLHADPADMSPSYLSAAVQKAATLRKHDAALWFGFSRRAQEVADTCTPQQLGYLFYGFGKARFLHPPLYDALLRYAAVSLEDFNSHALMTIPWALSRVAIRNAEVLTQVGEEAVLKASLMRPGDLIKVAVGLAKLDACPPSLRERLSEALLPVLKEAPALHFRGCMHPLAVLGVYTQPLQMFVMERFSKVFICARPPHLEKALQSAVGLRVLQPQTWAALPRKVRQFYARLSLRRIPMPSRRPSAFHWDVSDCLAALEVPHRNTFHWGCFWIDIGEAGDRRRCLFVDGPAAFYTSTTHYTQAVKLQHRLLSDLGWEVRRVRWFEWLLLETKESKIHFLRKLREAPALPSLLPDPIPALSPEEIKQRLLLAKQQQQQHQQQQQQQEAAVGRPADLDL